MSPRGFYDKTRSRLDPLETRHLKLPASTLRIIDRAAAKLDRHSSWLMREWLNAAAEKWLAARERASGAEEEEAGDERELAMGMGKKKGRS